MIVTLGNYAAYFAAAGWLLFTVLYATMAPWWRSAIGRNMLVLGGILAAVFLLISFQLLFGVEWPARAWIRFAIFSAVAGVGWWRLGILLSDQIFAVRQRVPESAVALGATHRECRECGK